MPPMDAKLRAMLKELGDAISASVSESNRVNATIEKLRDHGYRLFLNLDARIGIEREVPGLDDDLGEVSEGRKIADFRIDFRDLRFLKSLGIDPTRRVRARRRTTARPAARPAARRGSRRASGSTG
jgi:hypothetical protein